MKKASQISLAQTLFTIEEDAYTRLESYLTSVRKHFEHTQGYAEIIDDIESRIAEQLIESNRTIVAIDAIERILETMGRVEDFDDGREHSDKPASTPASATTRDKKLYRNTDDAMIAGVAAGLAAYIGVEKTWVRLGFLILSLFNGLGIVLYIILWIIMPEARTAAQKLEMAGSPVTIETLSETVRERIDEIREDRRGTFSKIAAIPARLIGGVGRILAPIFRIVFGTLITLVSTSALIGILIVCGFLMSGTAMIASDVSLAIAYPGAWQVLAAMSFMLVALMPVVALLLLGLSLLSKRHLLSLTTAVTMLGIWFVAVMISSFSIAKGINNYRAYQETAPAYQELSENIPLEATFSAISAKNDVALEIHRGEEASLVATGRAREIETLTTRIENGILYISRTPREDHFCLFCSDETPRLVLTIPALTTISGAYGSSIEARDFGRVGELEIELSYGARADIEADMQSLNAQVRMGSTLALEGSASSAQLSATQGSRIRAEDFTVVDANIEASYGADIDADVSKTLKATATYGANISYDGTPEVDLIERQGGSVISNESLVE